MTSICYNCFITALSWRHICTFENSDCFTGCARRSRAHGVCAWLAYKHTRRLQQTHNRFCTLLLLRIALPFILFSQVSFWWLERVSIRIRRREPRKCFFCYFWIFRQVSLRSGVCKKFHLKIQCPWEVREREKKITFRLGNKVLTASIIPFYIKLNAPRDTIIRIT